MLKLSALAATAALLLSGSALAADCTQSAPVVSGNTGNSNFFNFVLGAGESLTCAVNNPVKIPGGYYGVFKVDSQGYATTADGEKVKISVTNSGATKGVTVTGPYDDAVTFTKYYATGYVAADTPFAAQVKVDATGATDPSTVGEYDAIDILAGYTTLANVQASLDEVGKQQTGLVTHLDLSSGRLTGENQAVEGDNEVGVFGAYGSYDFGGTFRYNLTPGVSLLGGASLVSLDIPGASATGGLGALAVRYVEPQGSTMRLFGEGGLEGGVLGLTFSRHYSNGTVAKYAATGSGNGLLGGAYLRGGALVDIDQSNQLLLSASIKESGLFMSDYSEADPLADPNLFSADLGGHHTLMTTLKTGIDWTTSFQPDLKLTASLAVGTTFGGAASANVFGIGEVDGSAQTSFFTQYGARLAWALDQSSTIDGFVQGTTGTNIGTHVQVGAGYHYKF